MFLRRKASEKIETASSAAESAAPVSHGRRGSGPADELLDQAQTHLLPIIENQITRGLAKRMPRRDLAGEFRRIADETLPGIGVNLNLLETRDLITNLINDMVGSESRQPDAEPHEAVPPTDPASGEKAGEAKPNTKKATKTKKKPARKRRKARSKAPDKAANMFAPAPAIEADSASEPGPVPLEPPNTAPDTENIENDGAGDPIPDRSDPFVDVFSDPPDIEPEDFDIRPEIDGDDIALPGASDDLVKNLDDLVQQPIAVSDSDGKVSPIERARATVHPVLIERIDISAATTMPRAELAHQVTEIIA